MLLMLMSYWCLWFWSSHVARVFAVTAFLLLMMAILPLVFPTFLATLLLLSALLSLVSLLMLHPCCSWRF
jgi:hypothetical protein